MTIYFGPSGLGSVKEALSNLKNYSKLGLRACEIDFTYGAYIKSKEEALIIGNMAKELEIKLSIHAPYWINLNSSEKEKVEKSKERIIECCRIGNYLQAKRVIFHAGYYGKMGKETTYENIKKNILEIQNDINKNKYSIKLAPEIMGKVNVFGSIEEIKRLVDETDCDLCIDFAHILARYKKDMIDYTLNLFNNKKELHIHFSGIEYNEKGEKKHKKTNKIQLNLLISKLFNLKKDITLINESPFPIEDSILGLEINKKLINQE